MASTGVDPKEPALSMADLIIVESSALQPREKQFDLQMKKKKRGPFWGHMDDALHAGKFDVELPCLNSHLVVHELVVHEPQRNNEQWGKS